MGNNFSNNKEQNINKQNGNNSSSKWKRKESYYSIEEKSFLSDNFKEIDKKKFEQVLFENVCYDEDKDKLGEGSFGIVYKASGRDKNEQKGPMKIVIKCFKSINDNEKINQAIDREERILKQLFHPNIIRYYGQGRKKLNHKMIAFFFEQCQYSLRIVYKRLKEEQNTQLTDIIVIEILQQILRGLQYLHYKNIVHADLKMENILINFQNVIKISDFGQSYKCKQLYKGTKVLRPPEYDFDQSFLLSGDIWQFGIIAYQFFGGNFDVIQKSKDNYNKSGDIKKFFKEINIKDIGQERNSFLQGCLHPIPQYRYNASELLKHNIFIFFESNIKDPMQSSIFYKDLLNSGIIIEQEKQQQDGRLGGYVIEQNQKQISNLDNMGKQKQYESYQSGPYHSKNTQNTNRFNLKKFSDIKNSIPEEPQKIQFNQNTQQINRVRISTQKQSGIQFNQTKSKSQTFSEFSYGNQLQIVQKIYIKSQYNEIHQNMIQIKQNQLTDLRISSNISTLETRNSNFNILRNSISKTINSQPPIPPILAKSLFDNLKSSLNLLAITTATNINLFKQLMYIRKIQSIIQR